VHYQLRAVLCHLGTTADSGHYIAVVRDGAQWLVCDDTQVTFLKLTYIFRQYLVNNCITVVTKLKVHGIIVHMLLKSNTSYTTKTC